MKYDFDKMVERFVAKYPDIDGKVEHELFDRLSDELLKIKDKYNSWRDYAPVDQPEMVLDLYSIAEGYRLYHDLDLKFFYEKTL